MGNKKCSILKWLNEPNPVQWYGKIFLKFRSIHLAVFNSTTNMEPGEISIRMLVKKEIKESEDWIGTLVAPDFNNPTSPENLLTNHPRITAA